jgi:hypothetical protein
VSVNASVEVPQYEVCFVMVSALSHGLEMMSKVWPGANESYLENSDLER